MLGALVDWFRFTIASIGDVPQFCVKPTRVDSQPVTLILPS
jgi:hypothetical protein